MRVDFGRSRDDRCDLYPKTGCKTHHPAKAHQQKNIIVVTIFTTHHQSNCYLLAFILHPTSITIRYIPVLECSSCKTISIDHV